MAFALVSMEDNIFKNIPVMLSYQYSAQFCTHAVNNKHVKMTSQYEGPNLIQIIHQLTFSSSLDFQVKNSYSLKVAMRDAKVLTLKSTERSYLHFPICFVFVDVIMFYDLYLLQLDWTEPWLYGLFCFYGCKFMKMFK